MDRSERGNGGGGVPLVVWFVLGVAVLVSVIGGAYYLTRDDASEQAAVSSVDATVNTSSRPVVTVPATTLATTGPAEAAPVTTNAPTPETAPVTTNAPTPETAPVTTDATPATTDPASTDTSTGATTGASLPDGTYTVGTDIAPGVYRIGFELEGEFEVYTWTLFDDRGFLKNLDFGIGEFSLMVVPDMPGYTIEFEGGAVPVETTGPIKPDDYDAGTYLVGYDIEPGTYQISGDDASFVRLDGELSTIADASAGPGETLELTIKPTDFAVEINGQIDILG